MPRREKSTIKCKKKKHKTYESWIFVTCSWSNVFISKIIKKVSEVFDFFLFDQKNKSF